MADFPGKGKVAVLKTSPATILDDIEKLMKLADFTAALPKEHRTGLKINISWQTWYPACSSAPWQVEGVIRSLQNAGYTDLVGVHNDTVVVNTNDAERNNKHRFVTDKYDVPCLYLYNQDFDWVEYIPKRPFLVLDKVYPQGVFIPKALVGMNMIHLPTVKTHVFTTITGAMKNAFGGLLHRNRHWTHAVIHDTLVDLLMIQQDIHPGIFAVMDGTFAGDGPGPRAMRWHEKDILLASADQVAIDAVSAQAAGLRPIEHPLHPPGPRDGPGRGRPTADRYRGLRHRAGATLELRARRHLCQPRAEDDLPRTAQAVREDLAAKPAGALVLLCQQLLPQRLLVPLRGAQAGGSSLADALGQALRELRGRQSGDAGHGAQDGGAGGRRAGSFNSRRVCGSLLPAQEGLNRPATRSDPWLRL